MKTILAIISVFFVFSITGCSSKPEYVELNRENIANLNPCKVKEICIVSHSHKPGMLFYSYDFPIKNPEKIKIIIQTIQDANQLEDYYRNVLWPWPNPQGYIRDPNQSERALRNSRRAIIFKTRKARYETQIAWDDKSVYGFWWQSSELSKSFKKWNLFEDISKADPNWPPPDWIKNPPPEGAPYDPNLINLDPKYIPFH